MSTRSRIAIRAGVSDSNFVNIVGCLIAQNGKSGAYITRCVSRL